MQGPDYGPGNIPIRLSIADLLVRDDLEGEPREEFDALLQEAAERRDPEQIAIVCRAILQLFPGDPQALLELARMRLAQGACKEAVGYLDTALRRKPDDRILLETLARALETRGDHRRARTAKRKISELSVERPRRRRANRSHRRSRGPSTTPSVVLAKEDSTAPSLLLDDEVETSGQSVTVSFPTVTTGHRIVI